MKVFEKQNTVTDKLDWDNWEKKNKNKDYKDSSNNR